MQGLEIARLYYNQAEPSLKEQFPEVYPLLAAGLFGSGSECYGYDDDISTDHDFEPGFCLFLPDESVIDRRTAFLLERWYGKLPRDFMGLRRSLQSPVGGARHGIFRTGDFFQHQIGSRDGDLSLTQWLTIPEYALSEMTNGQLFHDGSGEVTAIRSRLSSYPEDVRLKKLSGHLLLMNQSGQYNYSRCLAHGETGAAQLAVTEFVQHAMHTIFLLNRSYMPYYKWSFRALRALPLLSLLAELLEYLLTTDNEPEMAEEKQKGMEGICADVIAELQHQHLTAAICDDLEKHAYSVHDRIQDSALRNMHILAAL